MCTTIKIFNIILRGSLSTSQSTAEAFVHAGRPPLEVPLLQLQTPVHDSVARKALGCFSQRTGFIFLTGSSSASQCSKTLPYKELSTRGSLHAAWLWVNPCSTLWGRRGFSLLGKPSHDTGRQILPNPLPIRAVRHCPACGCCHQR